jgi:phosphonate transport system ATP-binding protein
LIADERGRTVVVTSHQVAWVLGLVDRVLMLDDGRKVYDGPADGVDRAALDHLAVRERSS